ncbi:histone-lysine N-methyltransferase SETMAR [Trichonephila clavipes]|nr:histone-lysine N-methyltransferase SETMAR [Trichonephila clavipes]
MCGPIENPAKCEVRGVIRFLWAKKLSAVDIHRELCAVNGPNIMSEGVVCQWGIRFLKDVRSNIYEESRSGRPSVVSADLIKEIVEKILFFCNYTILELSQQFPNIYRTVLYETVKTTLGYWKFCTRFVPQMRLEIHKTSLMGATLEFHSLYHTEWEDFLNKIVTSDETWVVHVNVETKQFLVWDHTDSPTRLSKAC